MFRKIVLTILIGAGLLIITPYFSFKNNPEQSTEYKPNLENKSTVLLDGMSLEVEIADEPWEQAKGLSNRKQLGNDEGMLFIFDEPKMPSFWMKEMLFPLDMVWINEAGIVTAISKNISPETFPRTFLPPSPIKYVLEVNAGWSEKNNINIGGKLEF